MCHHVVHNMPVGLLSNQNRSVKLKRLVLELTEALGNYAKICREWAWYEITNTV
jgi:hypothetical protein